MRKTKIICTIGPASDSEEMMERLIHAGMNVARFNFSHGTHEEHLVKLNRLKKVRTKLNMPIAALLDTKGPEIRLRDFENGKVLLERGKTFTLTTEEILGDENRASISYKGLPNDVAKGAVILIDDGLIGLRVTEVTATDITCVVENGGYISNHKGINVPDVELSMPFISDQDREDIIFGCEQNFDFIACSFVRTAQDVYDVRRIIAENGGKMKIIAKIESTQGVRNLEEILDVSDGVMIARGDLGVEVPLEEVPVIQKHAIRIARKMGKTVVTATQMLDSMMRNPRPTRAEATDVANAIYDGTTAIMLSGETAAGSYPEAAVRTMSRIAECAEKDIDWAGMLKKMDLTEKANYTPAIAHAACMIAEDIGATAIITVSLSGFTARALSQFRPTCPVIACAPEMQIACQSNLMFGVQPLIIGREKELDRLLDTAVERSKYAGYVRTGDRVIVTAGMPLGVAGKTNTIRVVEVD